MIVLYMNYLYIDMYVKPNKVSLSHFVIREVVVNNFQYTLLRKSHTFTYFKCFGHVGPLKIRVRILRTRKRAAGTFAYQ